MASVNKVILIGFLGKDPEVRYTGTGKAVCNLSLATTESWTGGDGVKQEKTEWHRLVAWGKTAELCGEHLAKGRQVYFEGKLQTREYDDKNGVKRSQTEVVVDRMVFLSSGGGSGKGRDRGRDESGPANEADLPF